MMDSSDAHETIGLAVITCNRLKLFRQCIATMPRTDVLIVVNDGEAYPAEAYPSGIGKVIQHPRNQGVARSKNDALQFLLTAGCRHIFLCEDDIRIVHPGVCQEYVRASRQSGILHFNFGYHGPRNKSNIGTPAPRKTVDAGSGILLNLNRHLVGAFSYYRADVLREVGIFDAAYGSILDHVDHTYRVIQHGFHPPFWWFADLAESARFIEDLDPDLSQSVLRSGPWELRSRFFLRNVYFRWKHGFMTHRVPEASESEVDMSLSQLRNKYARTVPQ